MCQQLGIKKRSLSPYRPEGDGQAERAVQTLERYLDNLYNCPEEHWS